MAMALGSGVMTFLESCAPLPVFRPGDETKRIKVPKEKFEKSPVVVVRVNWMPYDVLLVKKSETEYKAIYMRCSHEDQILVPSKNGLFCTAHGSTFDLDGNVTKEPALKNLTLYEVQLNNDWVEVNMDKMLG